MRAGERAVTAAEETGLTIAAAGEIGRRMHPATGRLIVYVAAVPAEGSEAQPGDELTEVRWASPEEAGRLTDGTIFDLSSAVNR